MTDPTDYLRSWNDTPTRQAIVAFVAGVTDQDAPTFVPVEERIAVFDNDGTLWCEKPMPIQLGFILQRLAAMASEDPSLAQRQPWKAALERDHAWLAEAVETHYAGDDSLVKTLLVGVVKAFAGVGVDDHAAQRHRLPRLN
jgi:hypothetical protein